MGILKVIICTYANNNSLSFATGEYHVTNSTFSFVRLDKVLFGTESVPLHSRHESWLVIGRPYGDSSTVL
jgi:hypothetical protein